MEIQDIHVGNQLHASSALGQLSSLGSFHTDAVPCELSLVQADAVGHRNIGSLQHRRQRSRTADAALTSAFSSKTSPLDAVSRETAHAASR